MKKFNKELIENTNPGKESVEFDITFTQKSWTNTRIGLWQQLLKEANDYYAKRSKNFK